MPKLTVAQKQRQPVNRQLSMVQFIILNLRHLIASFAISIFVPVICAYADAINKIFIGKIFVPAFGKALVKLATYLLPAVLVPHAALILQIMGGLWLAYNVYRGFFADDRHNANELNLSAYFACTWILPMVAFGTGGLSLGAAYLFSLVGNIYFLVYQEHHRNKRKIAAANAELSKKDAELDDSEESSPENEIEPEVKASAEADSVNEEPDVVSDEPDAEGVEPDAEGVESDDRLDQDVEDDPSSELTAPPQTFAPAHTAQRKRLQSFSSQAVRAPAVDDRPSPSVDANSRKSAKPTA
ncbi:MAG: hypothetical protein ACHQJ6_03775 [Candidatus Berkiellales bacterium]